MWTVEEMVERARKDGASDIHLICGQCPKYRRDGQLENMSDEILTHDDCEGVARWLAGDAYEKMSRIGELDMAGTYAGSRCRIHLFRQQGEVSLALRILHGNIPRMDSLGLPPGAIDLPKLHKGIVLVTGETGSGKSTTLAAMMDEINHTRKAHIVTLEDPVEYLYTPDQCAINQREVGRDTVSFSEGLRASLREDPDVILIGEMRDADTIGTAITAAETGHLVFATLHTSSAADSVDRIVQSFPADSQQQIRMQLSMTLKAVLSQQLIRRKGGGRTLACEVMVVTDAIRNLIREGKTPQIQNAIATSQAIGGQTMDQALVRLLRAGVITKDAALEYCNDAAYVGKNSMLR